MSVFITAVNSVNNFINRIVNPEALEFNAVVPEDVKKKIFNEVMTERECLPVRRVCKSWKDLTEFKMLPFLIERTKSAALMAIYQIFTFELSKRFDFDVDRIVFARRHGYTPYSFGRNCKKPPLTDDSLRQLALEIGREATPLELACMTPGRRAFEDDRIRRETQHKELNANADKLGVKRPRREDISMADWLIQKLYIELGLV